MADHPSAPAHRWPPTYAATLAIFLALAGMPVCIWVAERWLGGVLGGAAAGLLAVPISLLLAWLATRKPGWDEPSTPDRPGATTAALVVIVAYAGLLWAALGDWDRLLFAGLLLPLAVGIWLWGALGADRALKLGFPVGFAWFALPYEHFFRESLDKPLQAWTADIALQGLRVAGYDMWYVDAYTITSTEYFIIVNETCSGMNMLVTLSMYVLIFAWLVQPRMRNRLALLGLVFPLAMLANGLRVAIIYLLGHYGGVPAAEGFWHTGSAYVIFLPVFWFVYVVDRALSARDRRRAKSAPPSKPSPQSPIHQSPHRT